MSSHDIPTTNIDLSHHIQREIMMLLRQNGDRTYQQLKPDGVEGNAFNYHLRQLKKIGLIDGSDNGYTLTPRGHLVADGFSSPKARLMMRPFAHTAVLVTSGDKIMLYKATRQPLKGLYCFPSGKMRYGEDLPASITRELERREITGRYTSTFICQTNVLYLKDGEVIIHRPGTIWHIDYAGELKDSTTPNGESSWYNRSELGDLNPLSPEVTEALARIDNDSHDPIDLSYEIPETA